MKVVVGLGNPGGRYQGTRHNVGFDVVDSLAASPHAGRFQGRFQAQLAELHEDGEKILLVKPETFMNLSGRSVRQVLDFYQVTAEDLLVVCDDINLPLGKLRIRRAGRTAATTACATFRTTWAASSTPGCGSGWTPRATTRWTMCWAASAPQSGR